MFGRKKEGRQRPIRGGLSQFGLIDVPDVDGLASVDQFGNLDSMLGVDDNSDDVLEAELEALLTEKPSSKHSQAHQRPKRPASIDVKVVDCMRTISDDDVSDDEDDPDLLAELATLVPETVEKSQEQQLPQLSSPSAPVSYTNFSPGFEAPLPPPCSKNSPHPSELSPAPAGPAQSLQKTDVITILERLEMYKLAEANAKLAGESSRARRFGRGVKTLNDLLKKVKTEQFITEEDIPPPVATGAQKKTLQPADLDQPETVSAVPVTAEISSVNEDDCSGMQASSSSSSQVKITSTRTDAETLKMLSEHKNQYKKAAIAAKKSGDTEKAVDYVKTMKQFEAVIEAAEQGRQVDLSEMPPPPPGFELTSVHVLESTSAFTPYIISEPVSNRINVLQQRSVEKEPQSLSTAPEQVPAEQSSEERIPLDLSIYGAPPPPQTVLEALEQRLVKYQSVEAAAKTDGNFSKARRMGRIVKQYQEATRQYKAGKVILYDELPTPPGFAPIPGTGSPSDAEASANPDKSAVPSMAALVPTEGSLDTSAQSSVSSTKPASQASAGGSSANISSQAVSTKPASQTSVGGSSAKISSQAPEQKVNVRKLHQSTQEKQLALLQERKKMLKQAALEAKRKGEKNQALEYLRQAKGFDPLIDASRMGLPVDMNTLPIPPQLKASLDMDFEMVSTKDCISIDNTYEMYKKLEDELLSQTNMCMQTRDYFKSIGDVASANRFEHLGMNSKKDLNAVRFALKRGDSVPKFHYEMKTFSIVKCCTDLGDNDLELTILRGINYNVSNPKEVDTYVKYEFPYPSEDPPRDRTDIVKDTNNPEYNQTFLIPINRSARASQRVFRRHAIKCEVWAKGGWFKSDTLVGTGMVKLQPLETKCILHDAFILMDGRKPVGGKLEIKIRIRNPIITKQIEQNSEKWLIIDSV